MYDLDAAYSPKFFRQRKSLAWRVPIMAEAIDEILHPKSVIDLGCGNGDLLSWFHERGRFVFGIEGTRNCVSSLMIPESKFVQWDLRFDFSRFAVFYPFDLALCLEVAEHIGEDYARNLINNVCASSKRVLFSAAYPGQGGRHHVNCQYKPYWIEMFLARGYLRNKITEDLIKHKIKHKAHVKGIKAWYQNLIYFEQELNIKGRFNG